MAADSDSATGAELHPLLVSPRRLLWARRLPYVLVLVLTGIAAYLLWSWAIQTSNPDASALMLGLFAIALGALHLPPPLHEPNGSVPRRYRTAMEITAASVEGAVHRQVERHFLRQPRSSG